MDLGEVDAAAGVGGALGGGVQGSRKEKVAAHEVFQQKVAAKCVIFLFFFF